MKLSERLAATQPAGAEADRPDARSRIAQALGRSLPAAPPSPEYSDPPVAADPSPVSAGTTTVRTSRRTCCRPSSSATNPSSRRSRPAPATCDPLAGLKRKVHQSAARGARPDAVRRPARRDRAGEPGPADAAGGHRVRGDAAQRRATATRIANEVSDEILGHGPLEPFLRDPEVTEIMVNGPTRSTSSAPAGCYAVDARSPTTHHLRRTIDKIVGRVGRRVDESSPMVDARLPDGSRVNAVSRRSPSTARLLTIRKFAADPFTGQRPHLFGTITPRPRDLLDGVRARPAQHPDQRRHRLGQDDDAQRPVVVHPGRRADRHHRGRRRAPAAPGARRPDGVAPANIEGTRRGHASATWSATRCGCGPTGSSSARSATARRSTCSRR